MLKKELAFIERFKARASHAAQVQSRVKKLDKIEKVEPPKVRKTVDFEFRGAPRSGEDVAKLRRRRARPTARAAIYDGLDFLVRRGERWAIMGANGAGKSTLLKMIAGEGQPDAGTRGGGRQRQDRLLRPARHGAARRRADGLGDAGARLPQGQRRLAAHAGRLLRLLRRRDREALPRPLRRREGPAGAGADALRPAQLPGARRADQPPRRRHQGDAGAGAGRLRRDHDLRLPRPALPRAPSPTACWS